MFDIPSSEHLKLTEPIKGFILDSQDRSQEHSGDFQKTIIVQYISNALEKLNVNSIDELYIKDNGNRNYYTPAQYACFKNNSKLLEFFIEQGAEIKNIDSLPYYKPFFHSARKGNAEITKVLLDKGYGVNEKDMHDCTALVYAARSNKEEVVNVLLDPDCNYGCDVNHQDRGGNTALSYAVRNGNENMVKRLIEQSGIDINLPNRMKITPLMYAAENNHIDVLNLLLKHSDININAQDAMKLSALHLAVKEGNIEAVKLLLGRDDIDCNVRDMDGYTPSDYAAIENENKIVELFEGKKSSPSPGIQDIFKEQIEKKLDLLQDYFNQKKYQDIINEFEEKNFFDKLDNVSKIKINLYLGKSYYFLRKYSKATKYLNLGLDSMESQEDLIKNLQIIKDELHFYKGKSLYILKKYNSANTHFDKVHESSPFYLEALLYKGFSYENFKDDHHKDLAEGCFNKVLETFRTLDNLNEQQQYLKQTSETALIKNLIKRGKVEQASEFFKSKNGVDNSDNTLLMYASIFHKVELVKQLMKNNADPFWTNRYGISAENIAQQNDDEELLKLFGQNAEVE